MPNQLFRNFRRPQASSVPLGPFNQGVNEKSEPHLLEFSELSDASNVVIDETTGRLKKRPGKIFKSAIPHLIDPPRRSYNFIRRDGTEILLITDDKKLVATQDLITFSDITPAAFLGGGQFIGGGFALEFETAEDKVWISNGSNYVFSWDGTVDSPSTSSLVAHDRGSQEITLNAGDGASQISDALLDRAADGTTWVGQRIVVTDAANAAIIGTSSIVLTFNDATDTITFDPIAGLAIGDKVLVGVAIPRGRIMRYHFGTLFIGATIDNLSEIRFNDTVDPNEPQITLTLDSPHAWPPELQLEIGLGDRLWGFSPVYRDRFAAFKANGIIRIDPDPTFRFSPTVISSQIGSRFPGTWKQHNNILMFLGQDADGLPDVYMTDFTDVSHFNRKHSQTLDNLKQPASVFRSFSMVAKSEFDAGILSSLVETAAGAIQCKNINSTPELQALIDSGSNVDAESSPGRVGLLGAPLGDDQYAADAVPESSSPAWQVESSTVENSSSVAAGILDMATANNPAIAAGYIYSRSGVLDAAADVLICCRMRHTQGFATTPGAGGVIVANGTRGIQLHEVYGFVDIYDSAGVTRISPAGYVTQDLKIWHVLLKSNGSYKIWMNGQLLRSGTALNTGVNKVSFYSGQVLTGTFNSISRSAPNAHTFIDYFHFNPTYKGDSLDTLGGRISPSSLPDTLPIAGNVVFKVDYKKKLEDNPALYRFGKFHFDIVDHAGPNQSPQTLSLETSSRNRAGASLAGYVALTNGQEPGVDNSTPKGQSLLLRMNFGCVAASLGNSQEVRGWTGGFIYLSPRITIGAGIRAWESFQRTLLQAFPTSTIKIRRATASSLAADSVSTPDATDEAGWLRDVVGASGNITDAEGFVSIADTENVGTKFGGNEGLPNPPYPDARFIQILLTGHVDAIADAATRGVDSLQLNWTEGSVDILPTMAVLLKKKWILIGATLDSDFNNIAVTVDGNRSFVNWSGIDANFLVWFRGKLYAGSAIRNEVLLLEQDLRDDDGPDGFGGRLVKAISAYIVTKQEIGGEIHERKKAQAIDVLADNDVTTEITVKTQRDEESAFSQVGPVLAFSPGDTHQRIRCPAGLQFKRLSIRAENAVIDQDLPLEGFVFSFERVPGRSGI